MELERDRPFILWRQVWGLAALLSAAMLSWMIYSLYQPKILHNLGFINLAVWLSILQGLLGALLEPIVGGLADRFQYRLGSRLPLITAGVTLTGLIFVGTALLLQWTIPTELRWLVPILMTLWVMSMIVFRGPVVGLLRQAAPLAQLPQANVVLTMVFGLIGAAAPLLTNLLNHFGASIAFVTGAIALTLGATIFYKVTPSGTLFSEPTSAPSPVSRRQIVLLLSLGFGVGLIINLLLRSFPQILHLQIPNINADWLTTLILFVSALVAIPMAAFAAKLGVKPLMRLGLGITLICFAGLQIPTTSPCFFAAIALLAGIAFGMIFESQIPLALSYLPANRSGLSTGLYFGGIGAATTVQSILLQQEILKFSPDALSNAIDLEFHLALTAIALAFLSLSTPLRSR